MFKHFVLLDVVVDSPALAPDALIGPTHSAMPTIIVVGVCVLILVAGLTVFFVKKNKERKRDE